LRARLDFDDEKKGGVGKDRLGCGLRGERDRMLTEAGELDLPRDKYWSGVLSSDTTRLLWTMSSSAVISRFQAGFWPELGPVSFSPSVSRRLGRMSCIFASVPSVAFRSAELERV
jgi:hypothetical protein